MTTPEQMFFYLASISTFVFVVLLVYSTIHFLIQYKDTLKPPPDVRESWGARKVRRDKAIAYLRSSVIAFNAALVMLWLSYYVWFEGVSR